MDVAIPRSNTRWSTHWPLEAATQAPRARFPGAKGAVTRSLRGWTAGLEPGCRIHRPAGAADLEIQLRGGPAASIPGRSNGLTGFHRLPDRLEQPVIMAIEAQVTLAVVDDREQA